MQRAYKITIKTCAGRKYRTVTVLHYSHLPVTPHPTVGTSSHPRPARATDVLTESGDTSHRPRPFVVATFWPHSRHGLTTEKLKLREFLPT